MCAHAIYMTPNTCLCVYICVYVYMTPDAHIYIPKVKRMNGSYLCLPIFSFQCSKKIFLNDLVIYP